MASHSSEPLTPHQNPRSALTLKLPVLPFSTVLTLKQKKSLFLYAIRTAFNYLGAPTNACRADYPALVEYVQKVFANESGFDKQAICSRAEKMQKPSFSIRVSVKDLVFSSDIFLWGYESVFCRIGTTRKMSASTRPLKPSHIMQWHEIFELDIFGEQADMVVEVWVKSVLGKAYVKGKALKNIKCIPHDEDIYVFCIEEGSSDSLCGVIRLNCSFVVAEPLFKVNILYMHLLFCFQSFEHHLKSIGGMVCLSQEKNSDDYTPQTILPDNAVSFLHQHALQNGLSQFEESTCRFLVANRCYLNMPEVPLKVVKMALKELMHMMATGHRQMDLILRETVLKGMKCTVQKCVEWLCDFPHHISVNENLTAEELSSITQVLFFIRSEFDAKIMDRVTQYVRENTAFELRSAAAMEHVTIETLFALRDRLLEDFSKVIHILKKGDILLYENGWGVTYTSLVHVILDAKLTNKLSMVFKKMKELRIAHTAFGIDFMIKEYGFMNELLSYIVDDVKVSEDHFKLTKLLTEWFPEQMFVAFMFLQRSVWSPYIESWLGDFQPQQKEDTDPFLEFTLDLVAQWKNIIWLRPIPPTKAFLQVFGEHSEMCLKILDEMLFEVTSCPRNNFNCLNEMMQLLEKFQKLQECIELVINEIRKYGVSEVGQIRNEILIIHRGAEIAGENRKSIMRFLRENFPDHVKF